MLATLNRNLFLAINAPSHPDPVNVVLAEFAASWLVYVAASLVPALWIWDRREMRPALLATVLGVSAALGFNQLLGLMWYEPRPFMIHLGHTLTPHAVENSFPSDHATFLWSLGFGLIATGAGRGWGTLVSLIGLLVAWARVYLGLHFPIDMISSAAIGIAAGWLAATMQPAAKSWLMPAAERIYEFALRSLHLPPALFPRGPSQTVK